MTSAIRPETPAQLADALHSLAAEGRTIRLGGNFSKDSIGGRVADGAVALSTSAMKRLLQYEPRDLTVSVEAGMPFAELECILAGHRQMLPLDPPWTNESTVGGVVAANLSGPRRRLHGTARDCVIGMTFATLEGKLVNSGGMVVKNVAGLDMAKLMIGSFGTLAGIAVVNFKVFPVPVASRTFVMQFGTASEAFDERDRILRGVLLPSALDIVNWPSGFRLLVRGSGNDAVLERYQREMPSASVLTGGEESALWETVREFTPRFLEQHPAGGVVATSTKLMEMPAVAAKLEVPFVARAGSGVIYAHYASSKPDAGPSGDFTMMTKVKEMFDPQRLLNPGRLYGRI